MPMTKPRQREAMFSMGEMALVLAQVVGVLLEGAQTALGIVSGEVFAGDSVGLGERTGEEGGDCFERLYGQG